MFERALLTILVWGLILEILCVIYFSPTPSKFEFAYSLFLLVINSIALIFVMRKLRSSIKKQIINKLLI